MILHPAMVFGRAVSTLYTINQYISQQNDKLLNLSNIHLLSVFFRLSHIIIAIHNASLTVREVILNDKSEKQSNLEMIQKWTIFILGGIGQEYFSDSAWHNQQRQIQICRDIIGKENARIIFILNQYIFTPRIFMSFLFDFYSSTNSWVNCLYSCSIAIR